MHKLILRSFNALRSFWQFVKIVFVFCIIMLLFQWVQDLTGSSWEWTNFIRQFLNGLLKFSQGICSISFDLWGAKFELKYIIAIIILIALFYTMNLLIDITSMIEEGYNSTREIYKKTEENALNKELKANITKQEKSINKYTVTIHTAIKRRFSHNGMNVDLNKQNEIMNDFIKSKLGVTPMFFENGFMYNFNNYNKIDEVLDVLFKILNSSPPIDYAICIQAGDNMYQLKKLISLKDYGKIIMAADTSYRFRFNELHKYQTSQIGIFQNGDKTIEVHEFREFS